MTIVSLFAVLWLVVPKTPVPADTNGWETSGEWSAAYAAASQHLAADLSSQGYHFVRRESLGVGAKARDLFKYADQSGVVIVVMLWRIAPARTGYSFRREIIKSGGR